MSGVAVVVVGSQGWDDYAQVDFRLRRMREQAHGDLVVIHGIGGSVEECVSRWVARQPERTGVVEERYELWWELHGAKAGEARNQKMLDRLLELGAGGRHMRVLAFRLNGEAPHTDDLIRRAALAGIRGQLVHGMVVGERVRKAAQQRTRRR